jgi:hypothetical protein
VDQALEDLVPGIVKPYVGWIVGMDWPDADEDTIFKKVEAFTSAGEGTDGVGTSGDITFAAVKACMDGVAADSFGKYWDQFTKAEPQFLPNLTKACNEAAKQLENYGLDVEYTKYMILFSLILLAFQIAYFIAMAAPSFGASLSLIPGACAITQMGVRQLAITLLRNILFSTAIMEGMDFGIQKIQMLEGHRKSWDWDRTKASIEGGVMTGLAFTGMAGLLSKIGGSRLASAAAQDLKFGDLTGREKFASFMTNSVGGHMLQSGAANMIGSVPMLAASGQLDLEHLAKAGTSGLIGAADGHLIKPTSTGPHGGPPPPGDLTLPEAHPTATDSAHHPVPDGPPPMDPNRILSGDYKGPSGDGGGVVPAGEHDTGVNQPGSYDGGGQPVVPHQEGGQPHQTVTQVDQGTAHQHGGQNVPVDPNDTQATGPTHTNATPQTASDPTTDTSVPGQDTKLGAYTTDPQTGHTPPPPPWTGNGRPTTGPNADLADLHAGVTGTAQAIADLRQGLTDQLTVLSQAGDELHRLRMENYDASIRLSREESDAIANADPDRARELHEAALRHHQAGDLYSDMRVPAVRARAAYQTAADLLDRLANGRPVRLDTLAQAVQDAQTGHREYRRALADAGQNHPSGDPAATVRPHTDLQDRLATRNRLATELETELRRQIDALDQAGDELHRLRMKNYDAAIELSRKAADAITGANWDHVQELHEKALRHHRTADAYSDMRVPAMRARAAYETAADQLSDIASDTAFQTGDLERNLDEARRHQVTYREALDNATLPDDVASVLQAAAPRQATDTRPPDAAHTNGDTTHVAPNNVADPAARRPTEVPGQSDQAVAQVDQDTAHQHATQNVPVDPNEAAPRRADPPAPAVSIADLLNPPQAPAAIPSGHEAGAVRPASAEPVPLPPPQLHPPRYVEIGALGETAVHSVELPADPREAARQWMAGLPRDLDPKVSGAIRTWLTEKLADPNRENWTDLLQKGAAFSVGDTVVYLKPDLRGFSPTEGPAGPRNYPVSFGGDGVESRRMSGKDSELTGGAVKIWDTSDEVETLGLPGLGIKTAQRTSEAGGLDIMSGRKTVAVKHDYFDARVSFRVFRNGAEIPYGADVPGLSVVIPFPEEFHRLGPLTAGDGPPLLPRHELPPGAAPKVPDHGVLVTAVESTPLALEIQRRALEAGIPSHQVATILDELLSTVHSEQGMKNRSQWWLTSGSTSEAARYHSSRLRSAEDAFRVTSSVLRMEQVHESNTPPIETRVRDDLGRRTDTSETSQSGGALNAWVGLKLGLGSIDKVFARIGGNIKVGKIHLVSTSHMDLPKVTLVKTTEVTRYDALVRLHVASGRIGSFDVDVRMELAVPAADAGRFERDVFGHEIGGPPQPHGELQPAQAHRQPAMLVAGRGPGLGTLARLPRSERLVTEIRDAVAEAVPDPKALRQVLRNLDAHFGRPALEADLTHLLNGIDYRTTVGRYQIEVSARGTLGALRGVEQYPMTVNERRVTGAGVSTGWTSSAGGGVEAAANARVKVGDVFGIDFPKAHVGASAGMTRKTAFASGYTVYYRTETDGPVVAFERAVPIDVEVRVTRNGKEVTDRSWQVDGASAEIVVPHQHLPERPVGTADVGRVEPLEHRPADVVDLRGRLAGVVRIGAMPDLALEVARAHADWLGQPVPTTRREVPAEILSLTRPSYLEANLPTLASGDGMTIKLPNHGKWQQALHVKVAISGLEHTRSGSGVEYEQYTNASSRVMTGKGNRSEVSTQIQAGVRAGVHDSGDAANENKFVATAGAAFSAERGRSESAYEGGMDVARGTYGSDAHWYRGDLVLETTPVRWKGGEVEQGPTTRLRVNQIMDLVTPDQVARHLGLEGPAPDVPPVTEHRGYVSPELAMTSGYVERLDAAKVLPEIVGMLHEQRVLFEGEEITASPVMEVLRARYGEEPLSASLVALRDGVITWLPLKRAHGFSDYVGVRVRAVVADGAHTAERPDVRLMLRSEHIHGDGTVRETGTGRGAKALARFTRYEGEDVKGGEVAAGRIAESSATDARGTGVKDINRVQTYDPSHEFTHPVRYEIEVVRSHEPPPGLEHLRRGSREALRRFAELTGNDAAGRFWDERRRISTTTRTTDGSLRLLVPEHLTVAIPEHAPVPGELAVVGEAPRWAAPVTPLAVNATLREVANQVAVPAAPLVDQWAPVAAVHPKLRGPVPLLTDRPLGYEISLPRGVALGEAGNPRTMRAQLKALLAHEHTVPGLGGDTIRVGINVHRATEVAEAAVKQRVYSQTMTTSGRGRGHDTDRAGRGGGSAGLPFGLPQGTSGVGGGRETGGDIASRNSNIRERNKEASTDNTYYRCAISLVFHGRGRDLVVDVPDGLYVRLSADDVERLNREHPGFIL